MDESIQRLWFWGAVHVVHDDARNVLGHISNVSAFALWQYLLWKSVTASLKLFKTALFLLLFSPVCSGCPVSTSASLPVIWISSLAALPVPPTCPPHPRLSQTHTVYTCSHWTLVFSLVFEHGPPGLVVDPVGFSFARVHTHTHINHAHHAHRLYEHRKSSHTHPHISTHALMHAWKHRCTHT